jgi:hypothetical protein
VFSATDADGKIVFEEFLVSYARPKPIGKNLVIMAVNTLIIYLILSTPVLDIMMKVSSSHLNWKCSLGMADCGPRNSAVFRKSASNVLMSMMGPSSAFSSGWY